MRFISGRREPAGTGWTDFSTGRDQLCGVVLQRATECHSRRRNGGREKRVALWSAKSAGDRLHLVQLSPGSAESGVTRVDARRVCCPARKTRNCCGWLDRSCGRDQSISSPGDHLPDLPALLDSSSQSCRDAGVFGSHFTGAFPGI